MEFHVLSGTGLKVSRIGLGTWVMGGGMWGGADDRQCIRTIHTALDQGINLIDTAPAHGLGHTEEMVGRALSEDGRRQQVVLATKAGLEWRSGGVVRNATRQRILDEVEDSLRRLRTSYIDLYQVHWPDPLAPIEEAAEAMAQLYRQGKIRAIGVCNYSPPQMQRFCRIAPLHVAQPPYSLFERQIEQDVLPYLRQQQISCLVYSPLCRGLLSGRMTADARFPGDDLRCMDPKFQPPRFAQYLQAAERLEHFARREFGCGVLELAQRWTLDQPGVGVAVWGVHHPEQLSRVGAVMGWRLDPEALSAIEHIVRESVTAPVGPACLAPPARPSQNFSEALPTSPQLDPVQGVDAGK